MRRTKEDAGITRQNLMDTSIQLFLKKGYSQTTLDDLVNHLNLTRGAFYGHFLDKEDLFQKVMNREFDFISNLIVNSFIDHSDEKTQLQSLVSNIITNFYSNKRFRQFIELTWFRIEVGTGSQVMTNKTDLNEFFIEETEKVLRQAHSKGSIPESSDPLDTAIHITSLITGIYRLYFVTPRYLRHKDRSLRILTNYIDTLFYPNLRSVSNPN